MTHKTVMNLFLDNKILTSDFVTSQVRDSLPQVTIGRYLITIFDVPSNWESKIPIEALVVSETLGPIDKRNPEWEFFGNGAVRCYTGKSLKLSKTLQWNILRKTGDKPYKRRAEFSITKTKQNVIPVQDPVFTRDVANNVWHLNEEGFVDRLISRFSALLTWQDEEFIVIEKGKISKIIDRKKLTLRSDLIGIPTKVPYLFNSGDTLF